ncbi:ABC transporter ATP-binding protein [Enterococcus sp. HY326]|uniref:ABC transporter ATP-binding protein n=1 Tax=Enterococcus sp. HY326 TaxID=2971265 RepID=UPI0022402D91|nr:ABC transporter ATP-binding protein [Enterococcus sp. HY326]
MLLQVKNLSFSYHNQAILKNLSFQLEGNQSVCLLGKNGIGKSTLFKCLLGFLTPQTGEIFVEKQPLKKSAVAERAKKIAYIPQKQQSVFSFTVFEMVLMGTTVGLKGFQQPGKKQYLLAEQALERLKIQHLRNSIFSEISGGEQQLTIIARAVAQQSKIILMDEPCANLDYGNQVMVLEMIGELVKQGYLVIQSTHDPNHALQYANQVLVMQKNAPLLQGAPQDILTAATLEKIYHVPVTLHCIEETHEQVCLPKRSRHVVNL